MKLLIKTTILLVLGLSLFFYFNPNSEHFPEPINGLTQIKEADESGNQDKRQEWFDLMHQSAPGVSWKSLEYNTMVQRSEKRNRMRSLNSRGDQEELADGNLFGRWVEKGSANQAGSVFVPEYDPETELIYLISAGGSLFRGDKTGLNWEVINQDLRFNNKFLEFVEGPNGKRLLAFAGDHPHYSDDMGVTWTKGTGIPVNDNWATSRFPVVLKETNNYIYTMSKPTYWTDLRIYKSTDLGVTYGPIENLQSYDTDEFAMVNPHHTSDLYLIQKNGDSGTTLYEIDQEGDSLITLQTNPNFGFGSGRANLIGTMDGDSLRFYVYDGDNDVFTSTNFGETWVRKGYMEDSPWGVGMYVSPSDPDFLMMGAVDCSRSLNGGSSFSKVNGWAKYYGDPITKLHADMMHFEEFENADGSSFLLNSNHGGLYITTDKYANSKSLSVYGLNVSQYYDVVSLPGDPNIIFAGTQDQGFQRTTNGSSDDAALFDQVISGDYGHIVFSENGSHLWTVYPGGWVTYYDNPMGGIDASWEVKSNDETVWIPPLMSSPDQSENAIYMAGGNMNGGPGSYLIKLTYNPTTFSIDTSQIDFDFLDNSAGGTISMMRTSPVNPDIWYVSTTNGRFFNSFDGGNTWDQTVSFIPEGHYLYGAAIYPSQLEENVVYMGGSGYSNPAVYKSTDNGETFVNMSQGLPQTLVFEITANADESMLFAATEAGPYVYLVAESKWFDMSGLAAPSQTYWSVEYLPTMDRVRFGTYGRGAWDFQIEQEEISALTEIEEIASLTIFPNPANSSVTITTDQIENQNVLLEVFDMNGKNVMSKKLNSSDNAIQEQLDISELTSGSYVLKLSDGDKIHRSQFVKI